MEFNANINGISAAVAIVRKVGEASRRAAPRSANMTAYDARKKMKDTRVVDLGRGVWITKAKEDRMVAVVHSNGWFRQSLETPLFEKGTHPAAFSQDSVLMPTRIKAGAKIGGAGRSKFGGLEITKAVRFGSTKNTRLAIPLLSTAFLLKLENGLVGLFMRETSHAFPIRLLFKVKAFSEIKNMEAAGELEAKRVLEANFHKALNREMAQP